MSEITQELIDQAHAELQAAHGRNPDKYFGLLYLEQEFQLPREKAVNQVARTENDYGLDGFHVNPELKNLYLFQFKWSDARSSFFIPFQRLIDTGIEWVFGQGPPGIAPDQLLMQLKSQVLTYQNSIERVFVHFVFRGDPQEAERSVVYEKLREDLENKKYLLDKFFGRPVTMVFQFRSIQGDRIGGLTHQRTTHTYPLRIENITSLSGPSGEVMRIGFVKLLDLHAIYKEMGIRFFDHNIRSILSEETSTNRSLYRAFEDIILHGKHDPLTYAFDHNGVTLFAEKIEAQRDGLLVSEPRILNGAQTLATFDRFLNVHQELTKPKEKQNILNELLVLCKIISEARSDFVLKVTLNNNRQNPVRPWNLHANDLIQLQLQDKFQEELGIYYERQEKAFLSLSEDTLEELDIKEHKAIELLKLAQTFLASDGEIEKMSRLTEVFESDSDYNQVFHHNRLKADSRRILLCYKIHFRLTRIIREIMERGEQKYFYMRRARNLVWALLCQGILNEENVKECAEQYGKTLSMETGYTELLARLASARIRFLISAAVEQNPYARKIEKEQYGFLKTKALYAECLRQAHEKWGWTTRKLS